jgi:hypothetical protein
MGSARTVNETLLLPGFGIHTSVKTVHAAFKTRKHFRYERR